MALLLNKQLTEQAQIRETMSQYQEKLNEILNVANELKNNIKVLVDQQAQITQNIESERQRVESILESMSRQLQSKVQFALQDDLVVVLDGDVLVDAFEYVQNPIGDGGVWRQAELKRGIFQAKETHILYSKLVGWIYQQLETI